MKSFKKILVPVDFSKHSREAVQTALSLAGHYGGGVKLVHVFQPIDYGMPEEFVLYSADQLNRILASLEKDLALEAQAARGEAGSVPVTSVLLHGNVASEIVRCAKEEQADLIVMGTHGRTGVSHLMLGSVAEKVLRAAVCPVLTVRAESEATRVAA
jgi:nucleotide-binding universal stress UspA family protein